MSISQDRTGAGAADYRNRNVVVTGAAGFIGTNLVQELCRQGARVTALDLPSADFGGIPSSARVVHADILDKSALGEVFQEAEFVFHLAARTDLNGKTLAEYAANHDGTRNVLEALRPNRTIKRFVLYSTQLVVGIFNERRFIGPAEPYRTKTIYGESKILAEKITIECCTEFGIPYTIIRPTSVYGPYGGVPYRDFILSIWNRRYFHVGNAANLVSMAFVKNVVDETLYLAKEQTAAGQVFFANDLHPYTMREFADAIAQYAGYRLPTLPNIVVYPAAYLMGVLKLLGFNMPLYPFRLRNIVANYCYDIGNALQRGYFPKYGLTDGVKETLDWYTQNDKAFRAH